MTDFEIKKRRNEMGLTYAIISVPTDVRIMLFSKHMTIIFNIVCLVQVRQQRT